jgi:hypothetical protein
MENVGIFYGLKFAVIWCISPFFGMFYLKKSGNPAPDVCKNQRAKYS